MTGELSSAVPPVRRPENDFRIEYIKIYLPARALSDGTFNMCVSVLAPAREDATARLSVVNHRYRAKDESS